MDFLSKYTKNQPATVKRPSRQDISAWNSDNAKTLLENIAILPSCVGKHTMRILHKLEPDTVTPGKNEQLRIRTQSQLNMSALLIALLQNKIADEVIICTYTLNAEALDIILAMIDSGVIKKFYLMLASSIGFRNPTLKAKLIDCALKRKLVFHLSFAWCHFKITLVKSGDLYFQSEGSMNYSKNNAAENLLVEENQVVYEFDRNFILNIMLNSGHKAVEVIC